ncbi:MAG: hypothetical protein M3Z54_13420 [Gemmatimonadota bacterium]|nr:hypothetical protein [Gemmatimonadota bacterium]
MRVAYERAVRARHPHTQLLDAVRDLVRDLKKDGEPPERVVVTIKRVCGMPSVPFAGHDDGLPDPETARSISETVIAVAIREYFSPPSRR